MAKQSQCVMIMAGGTGGHIYPALAVAKDLQSQDVRTVWLGSRRGLENTIVPKHGIKLIRVFVSGLRGRGLLRWLFAPVVLLIAISQSVIALLKERPGAVLGMGGFASGPGGVAAWLCRIPLIIHEQNARAGTTNKLLSRIANQVFQAFPQTFSGSATTVGNPVRQEICDLACEPVRPYVADSLNILVVGGSRGASYLNQKIPSVLAKIANNNTFREIKIRHQCGDSDNEQTYGAYQLAGCAAKVESFIDDMAAAYRWADVIICRAGAMTISEIAAVGIASILIPFPYATDDHQTANAMFLVDGGAALLVPQGEEFEQRLAVALEKLIADGERTAEMANKARALAIYDAAQKVSLRCRELIDV